MIQKCNASLRWSILLLLFVFSTEFSWGQCLMVPEPLETKISASDLIVEGKVLRSNSRWNIENNMIFTLHTVEVYKVFKGDVQSSTITVITEGGTVDMNKIEVTPSLSLPAFATGIFTLKPSRVTIAGAADLYDAYAGAQGFMAYDKALKTARSTFETYEKQELYNLIQQELNIAYVEKLMLPQPLSVNRSVMPSISNFSPTTVTAGTKTQLTINGSGFGSTQGASTVSFRDANAASGYIQPEASEYVSWSDNEIVVEVPTQSGTGNIQVTNGTTTTSSSNLTVTYNISNFEDGGTRYLGIHTADNTFGGYTFEYHTDFAITTAAVADYETALENWTCETGMNWRIGHNNATDASVSDGINIVRFDNGAELASSTIGQCRSYYSGCTSGGVTSWYVSEMDMTFNDDYTFHYGAGAPGGGEMDFMSIALHELGHGHQLGHVINSSMVMHFSISAGQQKRTLATDEINAGIYVHGISTTTTHCSQPIAVSNGCGVGPVAKFSAGTAAATCNVLTFDFLDVSENLPSSWAWDIDGDGMTDYTTRNVSHTYGTAGNYEISLTVTNANGTDTYTSDVAIGSAPGAACAVTTTNTGNFGTGIDAVIINDLQNYHNDAVNDGTQDFTCDHSTVLQTGGSYPFTVNLRGTNLEFLRIYIDYNNDGSFNNTDELAYDGTTQQAVHTGTINVPSSVTALNLLRMRVISDFDPLTGSCGPVRYGEAEDYGVYILCGSPTPDVANLSDVTEQCSATVSTPTATDPCNGSTINGTTTDPTVYNNQGTFNITWTYTGSAGTVTQTQTVIIDDTTGPVADVANLPDATDACTVTLTAPTATDNCTAGVITATTSDPVTYNTNGTFTVNWEYTDAAGNPTLQTQTVIINDNVGPVADVTNLPTISGECTATVVAPTATDNCTAGVITATTTDATTYNIAGNYTVNWTYTDDRGNTSMQTQEVVVTDAAPVPDIANLADITGECVAALVAPTATDVCDGAITATTTDPTSYAVDGTYTVTWTYTDLSSNTTDQDQTIIIDDITAPVIVADSDITVSANASCEFTLPDYTGRVTALADNCSAAITVNQSPAIGAVIMGTTVLTLTADDGNGNTAEASFNIVIDDTEVPTVVCKDATVYLDINGMATLVAADLDNGSSDNCSALTFTASKTDFSCADLGVAPVVMTATDANGNTATCNANVTVLDELAPVPTVATLADATGECTVTLTAPTALDNCDGTIIATTPDPTTYTDEGTYMVTWTYEDLSLNSVTQMQTVIVDDVTAPVIVADADITVSANTACEFTVIDYTTHFTTLTDNCGGTVTVSQSPVVGNVITGTSTITLTANDGNGNIATDDFNLVIEDSEAPTASCKNITVNLDGAGTVTIAAKALDDGSSDNCSAVTFSAAQTTFTCTDLGVNAVVLTVTDISGNAANCTAMVTVLDEIAPVADLATLADVTGECTATAAAPTATDNCGGTIIGTTTDATTYADEGSYTITWTYTDASSNSSSQNQTVIIDDVTAPVIVPDADITVSANAACEFVLLDYTGNVTSLTDNCSAVISVSQSPAVGALITGTSTITLTADDGNGNTADATFDVVIDDVVAPTVVTQNITVSLDGTGTATIVAADLDNGSTDNCSTVTFSAAQTIFDCTDLGDLTVGLTVTDANGNAASGNSVVSVVDELAPVADLATLADVTGECTATAVAPTATDNCGGTITGTTTDATTYTDEGSYTITWTYTDASSNSSTQDQTVIIDDVTAPAIVPDADITVSANAACEFVLLDYTGNVTSLTDNCSAAITVSQSPAVGALITGTTAITLTADDGNGNTAEATFDVVIEDAVAPTVVTQNITVSLDGTGMATIVAKDLDNGSSDNCSAVSFSAAQTTFDCTDLGDLTVGLTVTDANGNAASGNSVVSVVDELAPVADIANLTDVTGECTATAVAPTATDNCGGTITGTTTDATTYTDEGSYTITWTYTDASSNSSTQDQTVIIDDVTAPVIVSDADITVSANAACEFVLLDYTGNVTSLADNCSAAITVSQSPAIGVLITGTTAITLTADDGNGNTAEATFDVVIEDAVAPTVVTQNITVSLDGTGTATIVAEDLDNGSTDNCSTISFAAAQTTFDCTDLGDFTVGLTVTDANGNAASGNSVVSVVDELAPFADLATLADVTGECTATAVAPTATDNCGGTITGTTTDATTYTDEGSYTITWTYTDASSNSSTQDQTVIIDDVTAPVIVPDTDITVSANAACEFVLLDYTGNVTSLADNCSAAITVSQSPAIGALITGTTAITLTADDGNGNTAEATFNVVIEDAVAPTVVTQNITVSLDGTGTATIVAEDLDNGSTDNCSTISFVAAQTTFDCTDLGDFTVGLTVTDANGNAASGNSVVSVVDEIAPVADVSMLPTINGDCDASANAPTATDNCSGSITATTTDPINYTEEGVYTIIWTFTDNSGHSTSQNQTVVVEDSIDPIITCGGDITAMAAANCEFTLPDYSSNVTALSDNCGSVTVTQSPAIGAVINSTTLVELTADDGNGNTTTCSFSVIINDTEAPTVFCKDITLDIEADGDVVIADEALDNGSFDNCSDLSFTLTETLFDCDDIGVNIVTMTAVDATGNQSTCQATVTVFDKIAPVPVDTVLNPISGECEVIVTSTPTAMDNCNGPITATTSDPLTYSQLGTYEITWTYSDLSGNMFTQTQAVIVGDNIAAVPDVMILTDVVGSCEATVTTAPTATDACAGMITGSTTDPLSYTEQGTYIITWSYEDGSGNISTQEQTVIVEDMDAPTPDVATLPTVSVSCGIEVTDMPTATDLCTGAITGTTTDPLAYFDQGSYTITWTYVDANGNSVDQVQVINVMGLPEKSSDVNSCEEYVLNGTVYTTSQVITETISNPNGCDTLHTINLTIDDYLLDEVTVEACGSFETPSGNAVLTETGIYLDTVPGMIGCDTLLTIDLTIIPSQEYEYERVVCEEYFAPDGSIIPTSGIYTFNVPGPGGCDSVITVDLTVYELPGLGVAVQSDSLIADATGPEVEYQWINCDNNGVIAGATEQIYIPTETGNYSVLITNGNCMAFSECYEVIISGVNELLTDANVEVYPNPFLNNINIEFGEILNEVEITLFDASGKMILSNALINANQHLLQTEDLSGGIYFLQLRTADEIYRTKVVKFLD